MARTTKNSMDQSGRSIYQLTSYDQGDYVPVIDIESAIYYHEKDPSYGGAQVWWSTRTKKSTGDSYGCGVIAAANLVIYLASHFSQYRGLVDAEGLSPTLADYMRIADELWGHIKPYSGFSLQHIYEQGRNPYLEKLPGGCGVSVGKLKRGLSSFGDVRGIQLEFTSMNAFRKNKEEAVNFIKANLLKNQPVMLLSLKNGLKKYEFHWVTITELLENEEGVRHQVSLSTWGSMKKRIDFDKLWKVGFFLENQYLVALA